MNADKVGVVTGSICAVHCLGVGLLAGALPFFASPFFHNAWFDLVFYGIAVLVGGYASYYGFRRHRQVGPSLFLFGGIALLSLHNFVFGHDCGTCATTFAVEGTSLYDSVLLQAAAQPAMVTHSTSIGTTLLAVGGGLCLLTFHLWNHRLSKRTCASSQI